jgi:signal transduction histidine kinase
MEWWESVIIFSIAVYEKPGSLTLHQWAPSATEGTLHVSRVAASEGDASTLKELLDNWDHLRPLVLSPDLPWAKNAWELFGGEDDSRLIGFSLRTALGPWGLLTLGLAPNRQLSEVEQEEFQEFVDVAAIALENSRLFEAQTLQVRELRHEDELRRSFISLITHEFRTPLASLKTSFDLIQESEEIQGLDQPYQRLLSNVSRSVSIMNQLTNDLSEVANLSSGGVRLDKELASPSQILDPVVEMATPLSQLKNQRLDVDIHPDLPKILVDARRLEQVLTNMVANAIKYTPTGGIIRASASQNSTSIKFQVSDNGPGIPQDDLERIFEPFYRLARESNEAPVPGTGLGLALAKTLIELHGGKIWAESSPGEGGVFCFTIPLEGAGDTRARRGN